MLRTCTMVRKCNLPRFLINKPTPFNITACPAKKIHRMKSRNPKKQTKRKDLSK